MDFLKDYIPLRDFCRNNEWPRLPQWQHWIYSKHIIAQKCIKRIGGRYFINKKALEEYITNASLEEEGSAGDEFSENISAEEI